MTPEGRVKMQVKKVLSRIDAYATAPVTGGYGASGCPDILICLRGRFVAIECKAQGNKPTKLQTMHMRNIERCGGVTFVIDENNVGQLEEMLNGIN